MRGKWKKSQLFLPDGAWLGLYVGLYTICNLNGQLLNLVGQDDVAAQLASLGPDAKTQPYPADEIRAALAASTLPISQALLDQSALAGVGNIAESDKTGLSHTRCDKRLGGPLMRCHTAAQRRSWSRWCDCRSGGRLER